MSKVYVGNLPIDVKERELDDLFYKVSVRSAVGIALGSAEKQPTSAAPSPPAENVLALISCRPCCVLHAN